MSEWVGAKKYGERVSEKKNLTYIDITDYLLSTNDPAFKLVGGGWLQKIFPIWRKNQHKQFQLLM